MFEFVVFWHVPSELISEDFDERSSSQFSDETLSVFNELLFFDLFISINIINLRFQEINYLEPFYPLELLVSC
jgi:hypothetical protein